MYIDTQAIQMWRGKCVEDKLWQSVLGDIELSVSRGSFVTWFKNTVLLSVVDGQVTVGVPNIFGKQQLEVKYKEQTDFELMKSLILQYQDNSEFFIQNYGKGSARLGMK